MLEARELQVDILPGLEFHAPRDIDEDALDGRGQVHQLGHRADMVLQGQMAGVRVLVDVGLDDHVGHRHRAAGQAAAFVALDIHQRKRRGRAVIDLAVHDLHLAGGAQPMAAGMRQVDAGAQRGIENRLAFLDLDGLAQGFDGDLVAHGTASARGGQLKLPLMPLRPGVLNLSSDLWPRPLSARLFFESGLNGSRECSHSTLAQSIFGQSGCAA